MGPPCGTRRGDVTGSFLDAADVVAYFSGKIRRTAAYKLMRRIGVVRVGGRVLITREAFERYLTPAAPPAPPSSRRTGERPHPGGFRFFQLPEEN
jgi:hypothetical protein